ncbi:MAG: hypothetical protein ACLGHX_13945 [Acidimicrobiia bacterium]
MGAATIVLTSCLFVATIAVGTSHSAVAKRLELAAPAVKRWSGWVLVLIGVWFLALSVFVGTFRDLFPV